MEKRKLIPVLKGERVIITRKPDLSAAGIQPQVIDEKNNQPNDHTIFRTDDGMWHLWACVRNTSVGRVLCHWESKELLTEWNLTGDVLRADRSSGESLIDYEGQEFLQSPFVVKYNGKYYMYYGGYDTGLDLSGNIVDPAKDYDIAEKQICLMTSSDGYAWERYRNPENKKGFSRVFTGPGAVRDECVVKFNGVWFMYYAGHHDANRNNSAIYLRTSDDLIHWSERTIAHIDKDPINSGFNPESPYVVYKEGYYYLFRTHGRNPGTYVYRSDNPYSFPSDEEDFSINGAGGLVCILPLIAPEIFSDECGKEYISDIIHPEEGYAINIQNLQWEPVADPSKMST